MLPIFQRFMGRFAQIAPGGYSLRPALQRWRGVHIGHRVWVSQMVYLDELYPEAITLGDSCTIGLRSSVITHLHWGPRRTSGGFKSVTTGPGAFIGPHCVILPGVHIGETSVIKAGSVVSRNVPPRVFWGSPEGRPLAAISVPLTPDTSYEEFVKGLKPLAAASDQSMPFRGNS